MTKLITALVALAAAAGVLLMYTRPAYTRAQEIKGEIGQFDTALDKSRELQELKRSLLSRYNTFGSEQLTQLTKLLPDHIDNVRLTLDLDSLAARHGMAIQNVTLNTPEKKTTEVKPTSVIGSLGAQQKAYDSLTLQFTTSGTYIEFRSFLRDLESSLRIVDIVGLSIDPAGRAGSTDSNQDPTYRYNVSIRTYWLK